MIRISILYPNSPEATFDMDYYIGKHMPLVRERSGTACKGVSADQGIASAEPGLPAAYIAIGHILYDRIESFQEIFAQHGPSLLADIPNFTNVRPVIQISAVKL
jgi:uncharacterized protein (TIGR02118 family)